jgi:UDP-glucose 4-epimerase
LYNLGTGRGQTVLEVVRAFEKACGKPIPHKIVARRSGDVPVLEADPALAEKELGWVASRGIDEMCVDSWRWQQMNPDGFNTK